MGLNDFRVQALLAVSDLDRARRFHGQKGSRGVRSAGSRLAFAHLALVGA